MGRPIRILPLPPVLFTPLSVTFSPLFGMLLVVAALACLAVALFSDDLFQLDYSLPSHRLRFSYTVHCWRIFPDSRIPFAHFPIQW